MENNKNVLNKGMVTFIMSIGAVFTVVLMLSIMGSMTLSLEYKTIYTLFGATLIIVAAANMVLETEIVSKKIKLITLFAGLSVIVFFIVLNSKMLNSSDMYRAINFKEVSKSEINFTKTRSVTLDMAFRIANKVLGTEYKGVQISSQYQLNVSQASVQTVNGELVWVLPLDYSGFTKWLNQDYIPGYVVVSATNPDSKAELVLDQKMIVSENSYFLSNIDRLVYFKSGLKKIETHFEINDQGKPYFISAVLKPTIKMTGYKTAYIFVTDASNGVSEKVELKDINTKYPWIDRVISEDFTEQQISWFGELSLGYLNTWFGGENINLPTNYGGRELWFVEVNNKNYFFTGMTSNNSMDQSLVNGILVDTITGEGLVFDLSGVMDESGAVGVLDSGLGSDSIKWQPVLPQPMIIKGEFYWGSSIVSENGIFQKVGIVNGLEQSKVYYSETFSGAAKLIDLKDVSQLDSTETIVVNKKVLMELVNQIEKLNQLKDKLMK